MEIYDLVMISYGETYFLTLDKLIDLYGNDDRISFFDLSQTANGVSAESYRCTSLDGTSVMLTVD